MKNLLLCVVIVWSFAISSEEYEVKMLNFGNDGSMVFEPGFLKVNVGDTVHFKSVDMAHNSESSTGLIPVSASGWKGNINEDISITLTEEGVYVYQCTPHLILGMVGVIQVGNPTNIDQIKENLGSLTFAVNAERLQGYICLLYTSDAADDC